jgi:pectate lyase
MASGPRIVVFRVAGTINIKSYLSISNPYITIAGQTAPGGGILIRGSNLTKGSNMLYIHNTHDVVIQYIKFRYGSSDMKGDCISINGDTYNVIVDHCSLSWATDENFDVWASYNKNKLEKITLQNSISAEGLKGHSCGCLIGSSVGDNISPDEVVDIDIHHNLFAHNQNRNPLIKVKRSRVINNIVYNWQWYGTGFEDGVNLDIIKNLYKAGNNTRTDRAEIQYRDNPDVEGRGPFGNPYIYILMGTKDQIIPMVQVITGIC